MGKSAAKSGPSIALVRAAFAEPFRIAMQNNGIDADDYFRSNSLPLRRFENPESLVPENPFWRLVNRVAISEGIPDFGMQVARARPWFQIETMQPLLAAQPDLGSMLGTFCEIALDQSSASSFELSCDGGLCRFESTAIPLIPNDIQMELYRVTSMIDLVRAFVGADWRPQAVSLLMAKNRISGAIDILSGTELRFAQPRSAIHFPEALLETSRSSGITPAAVCNRRAVEHDKPEDKTGLIPAIREILANYVTEDYLSIDLIADLAGLTPRSLQRAINAQGASYRDLLNDARRNYAIQHLGMPSVKIAEISKQLGYHSAGHFTRAFKRWTGLTPSDYRSRGLDSG